jgi:hypothetical protein
MVYRVQASDRYLFLGYWQHDRLRITGSFEAGMQSNRRALEALMGVNFVGNTYQ